MQHIVIGGKIFIVDPAYLDEPLDNVYPVYQLIGGEAVMHVEASTLQQIATAVPVCYAKHYADKVRYAISEALVKIDIRPILRLTVNNERFIHYLCGPVLVSDLKGREGGSFLSCIIGLEGEVTLYAGNTMTELLQCERHNIPAKKNGSLVLLHDVYLEEAIETLVAMTKRKDACEKSVMYSQWKDPNKLPKPEEGHHELHCKWCMSMGLNGKHGNYWANDGIVYEDRTYHTAKSPFIQGGSDDPTQCDKGRS